MAVIALVLAIVMVLFRPLGTRSPADGPEVVASNRTDFLHRHLETNVPTRYNPCEPLRYVVNDSMGPDGWTTVLEDVMDEVSGLTGITFQFEGRTAEPVEADVRSQLRRAYGWPRDVEGYAKGYQQLFRRPSYQPERYGPDRWAPVLVGFRSFGEVNVGYNRHVAGVGASDPREHAKSVVFVSGTLVLNADLAHHDLRTTIMHELVHVLGLAHVGSPQEIMHKMQRDQTEWGPGDQEGLRMLGRASGCVPTPPPGS